MTLLPTEISCQVNEYSLTRCHIAHKFEAHGIDSDRLGGDAEIFVAFHTVFRVLSQAKRSNTLRVPEGEEPDAVDEKDSRIASLATPAPVRR